MESIRDLLQMRKNELDKYKLIVVKRLEKLKYKGTPKYHICVDSNKGQCYLKKDNFSAKGKYARGSELRIVEQVANYEYLNKMVKLIDKEIENIERISKTLGKTSAEDYYGTLCKGRQNLIIPIRQTDEQYVEEWLSEPYEGGSFGVGDAEYYTEKNERVRSKSEILIANALKKHGVPYKYECPLYLEGLGVIHPDFTALNVRRRKILYWEHLGKMDDEDYANKNVNRINIYEKNGLFKGEKLILTWETSKTPLDVLLMDSVIKHYLLE